MAAGPDTAAGVVAAAGPSTAAEVAAAVGIAAAAAVVAEPLWWRAASWLILRKRERESPRFETDLQRKRWGLEIGRAHV